MCRPRRELGWWSGRAGSLLAGMLAPVADVKARQVAGWSGERGAQAVESGGDLGGPPPGAVNLQADLAGGAGELGGGVQHPVAEGGDLAAGQRRHVREADQLGPADQVGGGEHGLQPGTVFLPAPAGQVPQPRCLRLPDAVPGPGMLAVPQFQPCHLPRGRAARAAARERAWEAGAAPEPGQELRIDFDATISIAHSEKQDAAATWKKTFGFHPLLAFLDRPEVAGGEGWPGCCARGTRAATPPPIM